MEYFLSNTEDQSFWITIDSLVFNIRLHMFRDMLFADVYNNGEPVVIGHRVFPNTWILPYSTLDGRANFRLESRRPDASEYPSYNDFNTKFVFMAYGKSELSELEE